MRFYSTNNAKNIVDLREAVLQSLPEDKGLYMPTEIPKLSPSFFNSIHGMSLQEMAIEMCTPFLTSDFSKAEIQEIVESSINFPAPLVQVEEGIHSLELWHGPTLAFKDFGARFMAALMSRLVAQEKRELRILVATSGDTGGAVASGFLGVPNVKVTILYPSGKVSPLQEKQLNTLGENIMAIEVDGTFDDCQTLVKAAFLDKELKEKLMMGSANSINISRLIPQTFYYVNALAQLEKNAKAIISVPSGNFGNLTAGLLAKKMGLPVHGFIAATNLNDIVPAYLSSGEFNPRPSIQTISNAMDVGNPSNFPRMMALYNGDLARIKEDVKGISYSDKLTEQSISELHERTGYVMDPHGAIAYRALKELLKEGQEGIFFETAHPAKFLPTMRSILGDIEVPEALSSLKDKKGISHKSPVDLAQIKDLILSQE
jgi:threonine synthase